MSNPGKLFVCVGMMQNLFYLVGVFSNRVLVGDPRTNNFLEGWHNRFAGAVGVAHPDICKFINSLKSERAR